MENLVKMHTPLKSFYNSKKVFLTGHTGFKGAWLLKTLSVLGASVKGYSLAPDSQPNLFTILNGDELCESVIADIRDSERLNKEIVAFQPDIIFHLAAQPLVRLSYALPLDTFSINALGTANLLESVRALDKPCSVVIITTDKVYHNNEWLYPYRENDRLGGYDPYSASKACAELIIDSYRNSFFNVNHLDTHQKGIAVARAGNVIGGGDWAQDRIIPDIVRALSRNEAVVVRNPKAVRPWQHVLEPLNGYLMLSVKLAEEPATFSQAYNFGPYIGDTSTVEELVKQATTIWGGGQYSCNAPESVLHEAGLLRLDITKAIEELGWKPRWNSQKALTYTLNWYKTQAMAGSLVDQTEQQIRQFFGNEID